MEGHKLLCGGCVLYACVGLGTVVRKLGMRAYLNVAICRVAGYALLLLTTNIM